MLIKSGKDTLKMKGHPQALLNLNTNKKKRSGNATKPIPQKDIRLDSVVHFPAMSDNRATCKLPGCSGKIFVYCMKCEVLLCYFKSRNCFYDFYGK